jgi:translation initiation factor IF-2
LATVRIYKVAELLATSSQEVMALLKQRAGIEVKSASSTIEEVVARQFVERLARERGVTLPPASKMFDETSAPMKGKKPAAKPAEQARPAGPPLPPPRLVKTVKPLPPPPSAPEAPPPAPVAVEPSPALRVPPPVEAPPVARPEPVIQEQRVEPAAPEHPAPGPVPRPPYPAEHAVPERPAAVAAAPTATPAPPAGLPSPTGRIVPPTLRLRIEDPNTGQAPPARPIVRPVTRPPAPAPRPAAPPAASPATTARPAARPAGPRPASQAPLGGPRPLPSQPIRPATPARPASAGARPGMPPPRPPMRQVPPRPAAPRREPPRPAPAPPMVPAAPPPITRTITLAEGMTVADLAAKLDVKAKDVLKKLLERRMMMTINSTIDPETAAEIARDFGADIQMRTFEEELLEVESEDTKPEDRITRAPVVTVMGHVDHGKTTLLDAIRETRVAEREAGGITQHIGAYRVQVGERQVVFLDTPGHEAFTMMRARGARVTDVVILVVAADDGVMPQTKEAIDHAKAANVPILVAINKIDKPEANQDRVKKELADLGLVPEEWGGQTVTVAVSAKKKQNLELLLEMVLLVTELSELKANPKRAATGTVLEAKLDRGRGPVATVLVQDGTLNVGDTFIAGTIVGKVRALIDDRGRPVKNAGPATPVEVLGLSGLPQPGDTFQGITDAAKARQIATFRQAQQKERALGAKGGRLTLESLQQQLAEGGVKELPIIIKADVQGSAEVLADTLSKLTDERAKIRVIHSGVGAINESDVLLASASNAIIIGFNVRPDRNAEAVAERERVEIRLHSVIYNVTDEMKKAMAGLLEPTLKETRIGIADVRQTFKVPKFGTVAGCMVTDGRITRAGDAHARLIRDHVVVYEGKIGSLRRFKDDVSEVKAGFECGIAFERYNDIKVGDVIEAFVVERVAATV